MTSAADQGSFAHVDTWVFDLDNTLYPADCNLFAQIDKRMGEFIADSFGLPLAEAQALRETYYYEHGTTLAGLVRLHGVSADAFLDYVHDIDLSAVEPSPALVSALDALPGRKFVFTNGSRKHAERVAARLGLDGRFEDIFDIHALEYIYPKPTREAYDRFVRAHGIAPQSAAMFDDLPHNLAPAHALGMTTVLVEGLTDHPEHQAIASWTTLPPHIHHRTAELAPFLTDIGTTLQGYAEHHSLESPPPVRGRVREGGSREPSESAPPSAPQAAPAPPQGGSMEPAEDPGPILQRLKAAS